MWKINSWIGELVFLFFQCTPEITQELNPIKHKESVNSIKETVGSEFDSGVFAYVRIPHDVTIKSYFTFIDGLVTATDTFRRWDLNEYTLVHANPWIIDSLRNSDYYKQMQKGIFLFDQSVKVVLHKNDSLAIPDSLRISNIHVRLNSTLIDVNIREYKMRIFQSGETLLEAKVRVGRNEKIFLELAGHGVDLRTPIGKGVIVRIERNPIVIDPETGKRYQGTYRDDGKFY